MPARPTALPWWPAVCWHQISPPGAPWRASTAPVATFSCATSSRGNTRADRLRSWIHHNARRSGCPAGVVFMVVISLAALRPDDDDPARHILRVQVALIGV